MAGKIFLSYRREDAAWPALALFGRLEHSFPSERLFMDVEGGIGARQDFVRVIEEQVSTCDAMLVLIGSNWLAAIDEIGLRRLDNAEDFVRLEVASTLSWCSFKRPKFRAMRHFLNAAFAYWKPREANRFDATPGAWYAALDVETSIREVAHHMSEFFALSGRLKGVVG
jgi:hypothetical protein